jgi:Ca2+-binding RTX toxin-like protein
MAKSPLLSYAGTGQAMVVDLSRGFAAEAPRVLPLGDSNTLGESNLLPDARLESYRADLWSSVIGGGDWMNYVGAYSNGPANHQDNNHQGVSGIHATTVARDAEALGQKFSPDVVLMMLGTNDVLTESGAAGTVPGELLAIMHSIERSAPGTSFLVAPLPPIDTHDPDYPAWLRGAAAADRNAVNALLPGMVAQARAQGLDAEFVPMPTLRKGDLYDGIHLTKAGHVKIADAWYDAMEDGLDSGAYGGARTSTRGVSDISGSKRGDLLRGDDAENTILGHRGSDRIEGMDGVDILEGGKGSDVFVFSTPDHGGDWIRDFRSNDFIEIDASHFERGLETPVLHSSSHPHSVGAGGQFLYDEDDGRLLWDSDGAGKKSATLLATLSDAPTISVDEILFF